MAEPRDVSDASLVERARRGDQLAFEGLVRRHYGAAYAIALALLGNPMDAEDVCQDAFIKALDRLEDCLKPDRFAACFFQIVRNRAHNFRDYQRVRSTEPLEHTSASSSADPGRDAERSELQDQLRDALSELKEVQRQVVLLHDLEGWRHKEIAEQLQVTEGMSRQHLFAARRILRERLGADMKEK